MARPNNKESIRRHYDVVSPYYQSLWGQHIHHGYWIRGDESKEQAQIQLIEHLAQVAGIVPGCTILDCGCGFGGTAIYLAKKFSAQVTGITISPVQVEMASRAAEQAGATANFALMDAEEMKFDRKFDVIWATESIAHYHDAPRFFACAAQYLQPGGILAVTDWFRKDKLTAAETKKFIQPIDKSMMVELRTMGEYEQCMRASDLRVTAKEILNTRVAKTWDISADIIKRREFWQLAATKGSEFVRFLRGFAAMRAAFASGNFLYGLLAAKKN